MTRLTLEACRRFVPPFAAAFQAPRAQWRCDGPPRTARRSTTAQTCPLPTPEDRLLGLLTSLQTSPLQGALPNKGGLPKKEGGCPKIHARG